MIEKKFGKESKSNITNLSNIKLNRKILENSKIAKPVCEPR